MIYLFLSFVFLVIILLFLFIIGIPLLIRFNAEIFNTADNLLNTVPEINYPEADEAIETAKNSLVESQKILSFFLKYSWIFIIIIVVVVLFIYARRSVEYHTVA